MMHPVDIQDMDGTRSAMITSNRPMPLRGGLGEQVFRLLTQSIYRTSSIQSSVAPTASIQNVDIGIGRPSHSDVLTAIKDLRNCAHWGDNWDAEGAPAPHPPTVHATASLVGFLSPYGFSIRAGLEAQGRPILLLSNGRGEGEITMTTPSSLDFTWFEGGEVLGEVDVPFDGATLPPALAQVFLPNWARAA